MNKQQKIDKIYEVMSNKELRLWTLVIFLHRKEPTRYLWESIWKPWVIYWSQKQHNKYHRRFQHRGIEKVYWNDVFIWDVFDWVGKNTECVWEIDDKIYQIIHGTDEYAEWMRIKTRESIEHQTDDCIDFIYSLTQECTL